MSQFEKRVCRIFLCFVTGAAARVSLSIECGTMDDFFDDFNRDGRPVPLWMRKPDSARSDASRADMEVVYAFYPGTGKRDLLEYNIVNAPIVPKWRERRTVAKGKYAAVENVKHVRYWLDII